MIFRFQEEGSLGERSSLITNISSEINMKTQKGLTLIELVIAMAIVGILTTIAWPYYDRISQKQYRSEAVIALTEQANTQESFKNDTGNFTAVTQPMPSSQTAGYSQRKKYRITVNTTCAAGEGDNCYKITATAQGTQTSDTACATITLDHLGRKAPTACWSQ